MSGHLLHVGFPKCASTSLQAWFSEHPDLAYANGAFGGLHNTPALNEEARGAAVRPRWRVTSDERFVFPAGEFLLASSRRPAEARAYACAALHALFPASRVLIVTRGFAAMIPSAFSQLVRAGLPLRPRALMNLAGDQIASGADYDTTVRLYRAHFGDEQVLVLPVELLRDNARRFTRLLEDHLGLEPRDATPPRLNETLTAAEMRFYPLLSRIALAASAATPGREAHPPVLYQRHIGSRRVRRVMERADLLPSRHRGELEAVTAEIVPQCRGLATELGRLDVYRPYAAEYLNDE